MRRFLSLLFIAASFISSDAVAAQAVKVTTFTYAGGTGEVTYTITANPLPITGAGPNYVARFEVFRSRTTNPPGYSPSASGRIEIQRFQSGVWNAFQTLITDSTYGSSFIEASSSTAQAGASLRFRLIQYGVEGLSTAAYSDWQEYTLDASTPQTVTLTPASAAILSGQYAQFTASGGQNDYQWLITGGGVTKNGNTFIVRGTAKGSFSLTVWSPEGNGYARSNDATAVFSVSESFSKQVNLHANNGARPVQYLVMQNGEVVAEYIQQPGQGARIVTVIVETNDPLTVVSRVVGITQDENEVWVVDPSQNSPDTVSDPITPDSSEDETPGPVIDAPNPNAPNPGLPNNDNAPVWNNTPANGDPNNQTDLLTNATFREGLSKIIEPINTELERRDKLQKTLDDYMADADDKVFTKAQDYFNLVTGETQTEFEAKWATEVGDLGEIQTIDINVGTGGNGWPKVTIPILGTIEFSPYRLPWLITVMNACREILLWLMVYAFCRFGIEKATDYSLQVATVPNVTTTRDMLAEAVPGIAEGTQYAKQGITALALVVTLIVAFGVAVGLINTGIWAALGSGTIASLITGAGTYVNSALAGAASPLWGFIFEFFPLWAFITLMVAEVLLIALMSPVFILASVLVRTLRA